MLRHLQHQPRGAVLHLQSIQDWGQPLVKLHVHHSTDDSHHPPLGPRGRGLGLGSGGSWRSCCWLGLTIGIVSVVACGGGEEEKGEKGRSGGGEGGGEGGGGEEEGRRRRERRGRRSKTRLLPFQPMQLSYGAGRATQPTRSISS